MNSRKLNKIHHRASSLAIMKCINIKKMPPILNPTKRHTYLLNRIQFIKIILVSWPYGFQIPNAKPVAGDGIMITAILILLPFCLLIVWTPAKKQSQKNKQETCINTLFCSLLSKKNNVPVFSGVPPHWCTALCDMLMSETWYLNYTFPIFFLSVIALYLDSSCWNSNWI